MVIKSDKTKTFFWGCVMLLFMFASVPLRAQDTYYAEFGLSGGGAFYLGDVNGILFRNMEPIAGAYIKYKFNGHYEIKALFEGGVVGIGTVDDSYKSTHIMSVAVMGEFNFFNFGAKYYANNWSWIAPYITAGFGGVYFDGKIAPTVPMGIGVKIKLSDRMNMGAYWVASKILDDRFDGVDDPIGLNAGVWNNRDWYSSVQVYLSLSFAKICKPCRNGVVHF